MAVLHRPGNPRGVLGGVLVHEKVTREVLMAAVQVHREMGPGLLESLYEECLCRELVRRGLRVARQVGVPVRYRGETLESGFRADVVVEGAVLLELKSVEALTPVHHAQLMTYLRLSDFRVGLLINFNVSRLMDGVVRRVL